MSIKFVFRDRDQNDGQCTMYLPVATTVDDAANFAFLAADILQDMSNAILYKIQLVYQQINNNSEAPPADSDTKRLLMYFAQNVSRDINMIAIPSPRSELFETTGAYANIRAYAGDPALANFSALMETLHTQDARPFGSFIVAGLAT